MRDICPECDGAGYVKDINNRTIKCYECAGTGEVNA